MNVSRIVSRMGCGTAYGIERGMLEPMIEITGKVRENRIRRVAQRQGLRLVRSRTRDPRATTYGRYGLLSGADPQFGFVDPDGHTARDAEGARPAATLQQVERYLLGDPDFAEERKAEQLAEYLRSQSHWRSMKAEEYPEDARNRRSADALDRLAAHVETLGEDDPRLRALDAYGCFYFTPGLFQPGEEASRFVSQLGFHHAGTGGPDIDYLVRLALTDWQEHLRDSWDPDDPAPPETEVSE